VCKWSARSGRECSAWKSGLLIRGRSRPIALIQYPNWSRDGNYIYSPILAATVQLTEIPQFHDPTAHIAL
jgi:hypothetical protein